MEVPHCSEVVAGLESPEWGRECVSWNGGWNKWVCTRGVVREAEGSDRVHGQSSGAYCTDMIQTA